MNDPVIRLEKNATRVHQAAFLERALPQWPVWLFCGLAIVALSFQDVSARWGQLLFGVMTGYQIAQMVVRHKAYKLRQPLS